MQAGAASSSTSHVWNNLHNKILEATYQQHPNLVTLNETQLEGYKNWVDQLYRFYTPSRLRRSVMNPAPSEQILHLMKVASDIRSHNANILVSSNDEMQQRRKMRILVIGDSVSAGTREGNRKARGRIFLRDFDRVTHSKSREAEEKEEGQLGTKS